MRDIKKKYDKAKDNEESNTTSVEKYKTTLKNYCERTKSRKSDIILNTRELISREILKQFLPKENWIQEYYKVNKKDKQGKPVMDTTGNQMIDTKFVAHDVAQLMRAVADLIDPVNESAELLKQQMTERKGVLDQLLTEQAREVAKEYELD